MIHPRCSHIGADVGLILMKLRSKGDFSSLAQVKIQFQTFFKNNSTLWSQCCRTCEDLSIDVAINYQCRIDIDEARVIYFIGVQTDRRKDRHAFGILIWNASPEDGDA